MGVGKGAACAAFAAPIILMKTHVQFKVKREGDSFLFNLQRTCIQINEGKT